jgi:hypothetical protein
MTTDMMRTVPMPANILEVQFNHFPVGLLTLIKTILAWGDVQREIKLL